MKLGKSFQIYCLLAALLAASVGFSQAAQAQQNWNAAVGGQSADLSKQAAAFLPNELWIHAGDSITWTFNSGDIHTVTFLTVGQVYPLDQSQGCPPITPSGLPFDGSSCVSSAPLTQGQTYEVIFPTAGNYEIVCLVHGQMFGVIHVLDPSLSLPHDQAFYDQQAKEQLKALLEDADLKEKHADHQRAMGDMFSAQVLPRTVPVTAGVGEIGATPGGQQSLSVVRFFHDTVIVHAGDTVEWANLDPEIGHTITFGAVPQDLIDPSCSPDCVVSTDADGAPHVTITSTEQNVHSGLIAALLEDEPGVPQGPVYPPTRFRITFTAPGTYPYVCAFHDNLGMDGKVIVLP
ncbi:MAG TPA: plastocyanin/azurin family copper-binding protein [Terriglobales bacterium]|nr:plastocyanin/azurin family copper-binding protein [Terriglobales bacterium]